MISINVLQTAKALYALSPAVFTAARNRAAKQAADRGDASALKRLPRASATAWAVSAVAREDAALFGELQGLGQRLRDAQEDLDPDALRLLSGERQRLQKTATERAQALAHEAGVGLSPAAVVEVSLSMQAVMTDPDAAVAVASGLLIRALVVSGWGAVSLDGALALPIAGTSKGTNVAESAPTDASATEATRTDASRTDATRTDATRTDASAASRVFPTTKANAAHARARKEAENEAFSAVDEVALAQGKLATIDDTLAELVDRRAELESVRTDAEERLREIEADLAEVYRHTQHANRDRRTAERDAARAGRRARQAQQRLEQLG